MEKLLAKELTVFSPSGLSDFEICLCPSLCPFNEQYFEYFYHPISQLDTYQDEAFQECSTHSRKSPLS